MPTETFSLLGTNMSIIWVVGAPRSGTSFITELIGLYTDHCLNEPWNRYPLGKHKKWKGFPAGRTVFKYCHNAHYYEELSGLYPDSAWVNVTRDPFHVLYSMCFPKKDARPQRKWSGLGSTINERVKNAFCRWIGNSFAADSIGDAYTVKYEDIDVESLGGFLRIPMKQSDLNERFTNRNKCDPEKLKELTGALEKNGLYEIVAERAKLHEFRGI